MWQRPFLLLLFFLASQCFSVHWPISQKGEEKKRKLFCRSIRKRKELNQFRWQYEMGSFLFLFLFSCSKWKTNMSNYFLAPKLGNQSCHSDPKHNFAFEIDFTLQRTFHFDASESIEMLYKFPWSLKKGDPLTSARHALDKKYILYVLWYHILFGP